MMQSSLSDELAGQFVFYTTFGRTALYGGICACFGAEKDFEVILPAFTCTAVIDAIVQAGAKPVFVEIMADTLNMNLEEVEHKITPKTRAIVSHHYFGSLSTNLDRLNALCSQRGIVHIEDCAHSLGARWRGKIAGSWGHVSVYSFSKSMVNPGGGCITTEDQKIYSALLDLFGNKDSLAETFKNQQAFTHMVEQYRVVTSRNHRVSWLLRALKGPFSLLRSISRFPVERVNGHFYQIDEFALQNPFLAIDISMTALQRAYIQRTYKQRDVLQRKRKDLYKKLATLVRPFLDSPGMDRIYNYFPLQVKDKAAFIQASRQQNIRLFETWPAFQRCWQGQETKTVRLLADKILLIHLDEYLNDGEYTKLLRFLEGHYD